MENALVLTAEKAADLGLAGEGPFVFGGAFPGEWLVDHPIEVRFLGFADADEAEEAFEAAWDGVEDALRPLEWTTVDEGEGLPLRTNHALSEGDQALGDAEVAAAEEKAGVTAIRTHKDADAVAAELGVEFPEGTKLPEKIAAIDEVRASGSGSHAAEGHVAGDPQHVTPAPGAEDTVPPPPEEEEPPA